MRIASTREQLQRQMEILPDEIIAKIADFTAFVLARRRKLVDYIDWEPSQWQAFVLGQFLRKSDEDAEYSLDDAQEFYRP